MDDNFNLENIREEIEMAKNTIALLMEPWTDICTNRAILTKILVEQLVEKGEFTKDQAVLIVAHQGTFTTYG